MARQIVVIGGGVIGTSLTWRLAEAGTKVTLLEANALGGGTSSTSFAWLNANGKPPLAYHQLNWAGLAEHIRLREELGSAPWLHLSGNFTWEEPSVVGVSEPNIPIQGERLAQRVARLADWSYPLDLLTQDDVRRRFPALALPDDVESAVFFPTEGYANVPLLIGHLAGRARALGAVVVAHDAVTGLIEAGGRVTGVTTASGQRYDADLVVVCAGRWTETVLAMGGVTLPMSPTLGLLAYTSPVATDHTSLVHSPHVNLRPDGGGRWLLANYDVDATLTDLDTPQTMHEKAQPLLEAARQVIPAIAGARIEAVRLGVRSIPADGFPVVGPVPGLPGVHVVATHSGVTMGPLLGRLTASEVLTGIEDPRLATFRPGRLISS